jgi:N-acetylglucosamine kinase-like BadF-type ATPase
MRQALLAIDVGGSTTRAYVVDTAGRCLGHGRSRGGNPASNNPDFAASSIIAAVEAALADSGGEPFDIIVAQIALAGPQAHVALARLETAFRTLGLSGPILFAGDLLAMFTSVTLATEGYCVVAGTGAGAIRIRKGEIDRVVDLAGWQLGDLGSGYWLGHEAARAAVAEMEGRGPATALTPALLEAMNIPDAGDGVQGRSLPLRLFIDAVYARRPIELAAFAPLVFSHRSDSVAAQLLEEAERYLLIDFSTAFDPAMPGPVALGGGAMPYLTGVPAKVAEVVRAAGHDPDIHLAPDGAVGAIVLALRAVGIAVDQPMFDAIAASVRARKAKSAASA